jgi:hypothetical protein
VLERDDRLWSFPGGDGDGLLNVEWVDIHSAEPVEGGLPATGGSNLTFVVAGHPRRLLAIDREDSVVFVFDRSKKSWRRIVSTTHFNAELPQFAWSVYAFGDGFAFAGADGPLVARLDALGTGIEFEPCKSEGAIPVSGPGQLDNHILFLCFDRKKGFVVASYDLKTRTWLKNLVVSDAPEAVSAVSDVFAAPVIKPPILYWVSKSGYFALRAAGGKFEVIWKAWTGGFVPELQIRPIWTQTKLWQFGALGDGQTRFEALVTRGATASHNVDATHLTAGECSFTSGGMYATPWDDTPAQPDAKGGSFFMPICGLSGLTALVADFSIDPGSQRVDPAEILQQDASYKPARLRIYKPGSGSLDLKQTLRVGNILQLQAAVFDGHLIVYDTIYGSISAWKIN